MGGAISIPFEESGSIVLCTPVQNSFLQITSEINAIQAGEGTPSPNNIRPLTGWEHIDLWSGGENLIDLSNISSKTVDGVTFLVGADGTITVSGEYTGDTYVYLDLKKLYLPSNVELSVSGCPIGGSISTYYILLIVYRNGMPATYVNDAGNGKTANLTNVQFIQPRIVIRAGTDLTTPLVFRPMITQINNTSPFESYSNDAEIFTTELEQTVYGGTLDWATGELTITHWAQEMTGDEDWRLLNNVKYPQLLVLDLDFYPTLNSAVSSHAVNKAGATTPGSFYTLSSAKRIHLNPTGGQWGDIVSGWTDDTLVPLWKAWLKSQYDAGTPVQMMVTRQEPINVQLSSKQIIALLNKNILYSNTGNTIVKGIKNAIGFRLSYLNGFNFIDLFPKTSIEGISGTEQMLKINSLQLTIPATTDMTQIIPITTENNIEKTWVEMNLIGTTEQEKKDYATITQFEIQSNQLIITRLGSMPVDQIQVNLLFYMKGVE